MNYFSGRNDKSVPSRWLETPFLKSRSGPPDPAATGLTDTGAGPLEARHSPVANSVAVRLDPARETDGAVWWDQSQRAVTPERPARRESPRQRSRAAEPPPAPMAEAVAEIPPPPEILPPPTITAAVAPPVDRIDEENIQPSAPIAPAAASVEADAAPTAGSEPEAAPAPPPAPAPATGEPGEPRANGERNLLSRWLSLPAAIKRLRGGSGTEPNEAKSAAAATKAPTSPQEHRARHEEDAAAKPAETVAPAKEAAPPIVAIRMPLAEVVPTRIDIHAVSTAPLNPLPESPIPLDPIPQSVPMAVDAEPAATEIPTAQAPAEAAVSPEAMVSPEEAASPEAGASPEAAVSPQAAASETVPAETAMAAIVIETVTKTTVAITSLPETPTEQAVPIPPLPSVFLYVGDFSTAAGVDLLAEALTTVMPGFPEARIVLVGEGPLKGDVEGRLAGAGLSPRCRFDATSFPDAWEPLLAACDVVVIPARTPQDDRLAAQALACGKALLVTHQAQIPGVVHGENGILIYDCANSLVWGLREILTRPLPSRTYASSSSTLGRNTRPQ